MTVRCEGEYVKSISVPHNLDPVWNLKALFYRKKPDTERVTIEVYSQGAVTDTFLGMAVVDESSVPKSAEPVTLTCELLAKGRSDTHETLPGKLTVEIASSTDLDDF